jgi:hypothetical protein
LEELRCVTTAVGAAEVTGKDVVPAVAVDPSEFETFALRVAVPTVRPLTTTLVFVVNVPVGLTTAAGLEMDRDIGVELFGGLTVAVVVAVWPMMTYGMSENKTRVAVPLLEALGDAVAIGQGSG